MVGITVVLAAVVAAFVFGTVGQIHNNKVVAVSVNQPSSNQITVTYQGGQDTQSFSYGNVTITQGSGSSGTLSYENGTNIGAAGQRTTIAPNVGSSVTVTTTGTFSGKDRVMAIGHFTDGSAQVLIDTYV